MWGGSTRGAFKFKSNGKFDYYASKRWLLDDRVIAVEKGPNKSILILTQKGLNQIVFEPMTLEQKASYFQEIQRKRQENRQCVLRYCLCNLAQNVLAEVG